MAEWSDLPEEMKTLVVECLTKNTRNALRACSYESALLVKSARQKSLCLLKVNGLSFFENWSITYAPICDRSHSDPRSFVENFETFEKLQERLTEILRSYQFIEHLQIVSENPSDPPLKLTSGINGPRVLVEAVSLCCEGPVERIKNVLSQIEPVHLREVKIHCGGEYSEIYDMPQIVMAEKLFVYRNSAIREDQLLKLNANFVSIENSTCSIDQYIKKCANEAETKVPVFDFLCPSFSGLNSQEMSDESQMFIMETPNPGLELVVTAKKEKDSFGRESIYVKGITRYAQESVALSCLQTRGISFTKIVHLDISFQAENGWSITIQRPCYAEKRYSYKKFEEFQEELDEIMQTTDFIEHLSFQLKKSTEKIIWKPREKQLLARSVTVFGNISVPSIEDLLKQIDKNFAIFVAVKKNTELEQSALLYDLPQIHNAVYVKIETPFLRDEQLLRMTGKSFYCNGSSVTIDRDSNIRSHGGSVNNLITAFGINQFLKKSLNALNTKNFTFNIGKVSQDLNKDEMVQDLDIIEDNDNGERKELTINSPYPEHVMTVIIHSDGCLSGRREARRF